MNGYELAEVAKRNARFKREIAKLVNENRALHAQVDQLVRTDLDRGRHVRAAGAVGPRFRVRVR